MSSPSANSSSSFTIRQLFDALSNDARVSVVTPNLRLSKYLKGRFDAAQQLAGNSVWATPDILPFGTFLERSYRTLNLSGKDFAGVQLLDIAQSQLLWEQVVRASDVSSHLLSVTRTAIQAAAAWSVVQMWELLPTMRRMPLPEDAEVFLGWALRFEQVCRAHAAVDASALPTYITASMHKENGWRDVLPLRLFTAGFDIITPQQQHFLDACAMLGVLVQHAQLQDTDPQTPTPSNQSCQRVEFASEDAEMHACAQWARKCVQANPQHRIGIVVPDLRAKRSNVVCALTDALHPGARANTLRNDARGFNVSLGLGLHEYGLVHEALSLIAFSLNQNLPFLEVSALLRSPFIAGANPEAGPRARLDTILRGVSAPEISLFALQRKLGWAGASKLMRAAAECPTLLSILEAIANCEATFETKAAGTPPAGRRSPGDWSRHFNKVLQCSGFPGDAKLDSSDHQILEKLRDALATLATLEVVQPRMRADEALSQLRRIVSDTVFQPEVEQNMNASIQVLGILESAGQFFDAIWVTGLSDDSWPLAARPNPFIPATLQRTAGVTEASAAASLLLDHRITNGWRRCAPNVVFSHAETAVGGKNSEQKRAASALTRDMPLVDFKDVIGEGASTDYALALFALREREPIPDLPLLALPMPTSVAGGAAVLRDQAACPFRAFARHRLGARSVAAPVAGLDAADRGTLLHRVLSLVWTRLETQARLKAIDVPAREQLVREMVRKAIGEAHVTGVDSLRGRFAEIEQVRLVHLVDQWLVYELERAPFEVLAIEQARDVTLSGLSMRLRLDRLDKLIDGTYALIDYKTGAAKVADWLGERPDEPQLPLYFLTAERAVSALAFARVKRGKRGKVFGFEGVSATENMIPDVAPIETKSAMEAKGYSSWDVLIAEWECSLDALVKNFINGSASVDPKNGRLTCAQCDLHSFCRVSEVNSPQILDEVTSEDSDLEFSSGCGRIADD